MSDMYAQHYRLVIEISVPTQDPFDPPDIESVRQEVETTLTANPRFLTAKGREGTTISLEPDDYTDWRFHRGAYDHFGTR
jgi:hypothetical protein